MFSHLSYGHGEEKGLAGVRAKGLFASLAGLCRGKEIDISDSRRPFSPPNAERLHCEEDYSLQV